MDFQETIRTASITNNFDQACKLVQGALGARDSRIAELIMDDDIKHCWPTLPTDMRRRALCDYAATEVRHMAG